MIVRVETYINNKKDLKNHRESLKICNKIKNQNKI